MSTILSLPKGENDTLLDTLMSMRQECEDHRKVVEGTRFWADCEASYYNRLYDEVATPEWMSREVAPKTWESTERIIPILTDSRPRLLLTGRGPEDAQAVKVLALGVDQEEDRQNMMVLWAKMLRQGMILGTSFILCRVERVGATYRLVSELVSPWNVYADPAATTDEDLQFVWIKRPIRGGRLLQLFPEKSEEILEACATGRIQGASPSAANYSRTGISPNPTWGQVGQAGNLEFQEITRRGARANPAQSYFDLWEGYYVDGSILGIEEQLMQNQNKVKTKGIGAQGAILTMVGDVILSAMPNPFLHGQIPLSRFVCYDLPGSYYGMSYIEPLLGPHRMLSRIDNKVTDWMALACDPEVVMDEDCGVDEENDFAAPGKKVMVKKDSRYEYLKPSEMPGYVWNLRAAKDQEFKDASGVSDVSRGNISGVSDDTSGRAIELLNEPTIKRVRLMQRNFESTVSRWGKQTVANLIQFKSREDWMRLLPPPPPVPDPMTGMPVPVDPAQQPLPWDTWGPEDFQNWPDVKMAVGSSLPINKAAKQQNVTALYQAGLLGVPGSVEAVGVALSKMEDDDKEEILQGMQMAQERMMQQQAMQAASTAEEGSAGDPGVSKNKAQNGGMPEPGQDFGRERSE